MMSYSWPIILKVYNVSYTYIVNMPKRNDTKLVILKLRRWYLIQNQKMENSKFTMNGNIIENVETYMHLGIIGNSKMTNNTKLMKKGNN